jgi:dienelactone hydrolase
MQRCNLKGITGAVSLSILFAILTINSSCKKNVGIVAVDPDDQIETVPPTILKVSLEVNPSIKGYLMALPYNYAETKKVYPTIVFFHGLGQIGNGSTDIKYLMNDGMGKLLASGKFPPTFTVGEKNYSFLVACPQMDTMASIEDAESYLTYLVKTYRVDPKRLYIMGMSFGSRLATRVVAGHANYYAALIPISGVPVTPGIETRIKNIAVANLPVWAFHNDEDPTSDVNEVKDFVDQITALKPAVLPKLTIFDVYGHDAWTQALDPNYKENGMNIYEWMLGYSR